MISGSLLASAALAQDEAADNAVPPNDNAVATDLFEQSYFEQAGLPVDFNHPWVLIPWLLSMGIAWRVMRDQPVKPKDVEFAPVFILEQLKTLEAQPNQMSWLKKLIGMGALTGVFMGAAGIHPNDTVSFAEDGPVLIAADTGWAAAPNWNKHRENIREVIKSAYNDDREIVFLTTAQTEDGGTIRATEPMNAALALSYLENIETMPWEIDLAEAARALEELEGDFGATFWMSNGLAYNETLDFTAALSSVAPLTTYNEPDTPYLMMPAEHVNGNYRLTVNRATTEPAEITISAYDRGLNLIGSQTMSFAEDDLRETITFTQSDYDVAGDQVFRFSIDHETSVGSTILVSENYQPRTIGIATRSGERDTGSLLSESRYLYAALQPYGEIVFGTVEELVDSGDISVLILPDSTPLSDLVAGKVERWTNNGGNTIRFAGPNLAREAHTDDPLLPVDLRAGSTAFADSVGATDEGLRIRGFETDSPFVDIEPDDSVMISRLASVQPSPDLEDRVWARLSNNAPLVTAEDRGDGRVVLFHTTASPAWGEFAYSDNFVEMLLATVRQSNSVEDTSDYEIPELPPLTILNSAGELRNPSDIVLPLTQQVINEGTLGPENRVGLYGTDLMQVPKNLSDSVRSIRPLVNLPESVTMETYSDGSDNSRLKDWLIMAAIGATLAGGMVFGRNGRKNRQRNKNKTPAPAPGA